MNERSVILAERLEQLISTRGIVAHFHPVVSLDEAEEVIGFELLARSEIDRLRTPLEMFSVAEHLNRAAELSELCRSVGYDAEAFLPKSVKLFVNVHPREPLLTGLLPSLRRMRRRIPNRKVVVEIHEAAVTDPATLRVFTDAAKELDVELAFDDFGIGRARLLELASVPPAYVKFDAQLIRNLDQQPRHHTIVLRNLIRTCQEVGSATVAEGVETEVDAEACRAFGFEFAQGYLYGLPSPMPSVEQLGGKGHDRGSTWVLPPDVAN